MSVDNNRFFPVPADRLAVIANRLYLRELPDLTPVERATVIQIGLQEAQVEATQQVAFFLSEAYEIYNQRFR